MQQAVRAQGRYLQKQELEPQLSRNHLKLARASGSGRDCLVLRETISIDRHLAHETLQQASNNPASKQATTQQATCMYTRRTQKNRESRRSCENPPRKPPPLPKKQARRRARNTRFFCLIYPPCWSFGCGCGCGLLSTHRCRRVVRVVARRQGLLLLLLRRHDRLRHVVLRPRVPLSVQAPDR